jgi:hypothetical protein
MRVERLRIFVDENKNIQQAHHAQNKERIRETKKRMDE